jgi:hypothetical protein
VAPRPPSRISRATSGAKKEKELAELQMVGGDGSNGVNKQVIKGDKVGRNDPCPAAAARNTKSATGREPKPFALP